MNVDGTLCASVDRGQHRVRICSVDGVGKYTDDVVNVGTVGTRGSAHGQLNSPAFVCFVHRYGVVTLLICDSGNDRIVEVTDRGVFLRAVVMKRGSHPCGIAERDGVIAVSLYCAHAVVLLQYESGAVTREVTIGSEGRGDGKLWRPMGVAFTADGRYILVADFGNHRVSKFCAATGAFIAHVATKAANRIFYPTDVLQCEDGTTLVTHGGAWAYADGRNACVVSVGKDGVTLQNIIIPSTLPPGCLKPLSLSYSAYLNGVVVKTDTEGVFFLRDAWMYSSRSAWLSALLCS